MTKEEVLKLKAGDKLAIIETVMGIDNTDPEKPILEVIPDGAHDCKQPWYVPMECFDERVPYKPDWETEYNLMEEELRLTQEEVKNEKERNAHIQETYSKSLAERDARIEELEDELRALPANSNVLPEIWLDWSLSMVKEIANALKQ